MNLLADRLEPYLRSCGIKFVRNDPDRTFAGAIQDSNSAYYDVHLALHSNAAPERLSGRLRGIDIYFAPRSADSEKLANIIANNLKSIYPLPDKAYTRKYQLFRKLIQHKYGRKMLLISSSLLP